MSEKAKFELETSRTIEKEAFGKKDTVRATIQLLFYFSSFLIKKKKSNNTI